MSDATIVGDDPVLESLGAFLAASLLPPPSQEAPATEASQRPTIAPSLLIEPLARPWPVDRRLIAVDPRPAPATLVPTAPVIVAEPAVVAGPTVATEATAAETTETKGAEDLPVGPAAPSRLRVTLEWIAIIAGALTVAIVIRVAVIQSFVIPSESMHPTLESGDRVLVNRLAYKAHDIRRGDVIVFNRPKTPVLAPDTPAHLIKRVIGLPGDTVVERNGIVYIDGRRLREPYLPAGTLTENLTTSVTIPAGHVWVMGDNRMNSTDSRIFGAIDVKLVVGRAFARIWPPSRIGFL